MKRDYYSIDILKFICSLMIVAIHFPPFLEYRILNIIFPNIICTVAVPLFFLISGFLGKDIFNKKNVFRLLKTYSIWSFIYFILFIKRMDLLCNYVINFIFKGSWYHLWYFVILIWVIIIYYLLLRIYDAYNILKLSILTFVLGVIIYTYRIFPLELDVSLIRLFSIGLPFYSLGHFFRKRNIVEITYKNKYYKVFRNIMILFALAEVLLLYNIGAKNGYTILFSTLFIVGIIFIDAMNKDSCFNIKYNNVIREISVFTYCVHPIIIQLFQNIMFKCGININTNLICFAVIIFACLLVSLLFVLFIPKSVRKFFT